MPGKALLVLLTLITVALGGCTPRLVTVHDGLEAIFVDAQSQTPIAGVQVYALMPGKPGPQVLGRSDESGQVSIRPRRRLEVVVLLGERMTMLSLWACKSGHERLEVASRMGWNADYRVVTHRPDAPISLAFIEQGEQGCPWTYGSTQR